MTARRADARDEALEVRAGLAEVVVEEAEPGAERLVLRRGSQPLASLCCEVADGLRDAPGRTGIVGRFEAADVQSGAALLRHARRRLTDDGAARVIGPMNGSTFGLYRVALPPSVDEDPTAPAFLMEPRNPSWYPECFRTAGFAVAARYESRIVEALAVKRPGAHALAGRIGRSGIQVRALDLGRFEEEFRALFAMIQAAFAASPYYRPVAGAGIRDAYAALRPLVDPALVPMAHDRTGRLVGLAFALPDAETAAGGRPTRLVLKTLATAPGVRHLGLGAYLVNEIHRRAHLHGYRSVIHALMHEANESARLSRRFGSRPFRRYALYQWTP